MGKTLPIILSLIGIGLGTGAGIALKPQPNEGETECDPVLSDSETNLLAEPRMENNHLDGSVYEYVKLNNQFIVPIVEDGIVTSLVVLALNLEVVEGYSEAVFALEPKLRNAFLLILFDHANAGGFKGTFTSSNNMTVLQNALTEVARKTLGNSISNVLITDVVRQDNVK